MSKEFRVGVRMTAAGCGCPSCRASGPTTANRQIPPEPPTFEQVDRHFRGEDLPPLPPPAQNPRLDPNYEEAARVQNLPDVAYQPAAGPGVMPLPNPLGPEHFKGDR
jgi:hypothetical protein